MKDDDIPEKYFDLRNNNYLVNAYKNLLKAKIVHFIFSLIEFFLNIIQEMNIFVDEYNLQYKSDKEFLYILKVFHNKIKNSHMSVKLIIILYWIIFDILYLFLTKRKYIKRYVNISFLFNLLEFLHFRVFVLLSLNVFFSFDYFYLIFFLIIFFPHIHLIETHFLYNHLYYFAPIFVEYPYDEFTSIYDSILLLIKLVLSVIINSNNKFVNSFIYIILFMLQIIFCIYYIYLMFCKSYLFMKNYFLNITKVSLFITQTFTLIIAELIGKKLLFTISFIVIHICLLIISLLFVYLLYEPKNFIKINTETPLENLFYYFYIISEENDLNFLLESKINEHFEKCKVCKLCKKYRKYLNDNYCGLINDTKIDKLSNLINSSKIKEESNLMDLFQVLDDNKNNLFKLINEIVLTYKNNRQKFLINSSYYFINLSFLKFDQFKIDNSTLSLNIKLLLEIIIVENNYIENKDYAIQQILFCNNFISLSKKILKLLKDICSSDYTLAKQYINLSNLLKEIQGSKYKDMLYNYKQDNNSNSKNIIMICSIIYEEIFNVIINSSQIPLRINSQALDDIFFKDIEKNEKIITLSINLINNYCKIIRAGKDLFKYKDYNLFDIFPLIFRDYQIKYFLSNILHNFSIDNKGIKKIDTLKIESMIKRENTKKAKSSLKNKNKKEKEFIEIKLIICEYISTKMFFKLLILKLIPLFNYDFNSYYLLLDGSFYLYKNTIMTFQNFEKSRNINPKVISVSKPELERPPEIYTMKFPKYSNYLEQNGFLLSKIFEYKFSKKTYSVYSIFPRENYHRKKKSRLSFYQRESIAESDYSGIRKEFGIRKKIEDLFEENASVDSQQVISNYQMNISNLALKNKKKQNMYRYSILYKIKNTLLFSVPIIILTFLLETIHLINLRDENINNNYSIVKFDEIYKLYFQLFSSVLSIACLKDKEGCITIASNYKQGYEKFEFFNFSNFLSAQNKLLAKKLFEKKNNLLNIHKNIGEENFKDLFERQVNYSRVGKSFVNGKQTLTLSNITIPFSESILISCQSFQIIVNNTKNEPIYVLNKNKDPFFYLFPDEIEYFSDYQKQISELILNYKVYKNQFMSINQKFIDTLRFQSQTIELYIYIYFSLTLFICIYILLLLYVYLIKFEELIIKILNYIHMIKNFKNDIYNFSLLFLQKIENLEIILKIYIENPIKVTQNLNSLYSNYQKLINDQNKKNISNTYKKDNKKNSEKDDKEDELDNVPMNQRIFTKYDIRKLNIMYYYFLFFIFLCLCILIMYIIIILTWINYSKVKDNLYSLISKNLESEVSVYEAINLYDLIIFNNLTLEELASDIFYDKEKNIYNKETLLNSFYNDLFINFNYEVELNILIKNLKNFPFYTFTCKNLYDWNNDFIYELKNFSIFKNMTDIKRILVDICEFSRLAEYNDITAVFQQHYQDIKNSIVTLVDNSYEGLINHLNEGKLGKIVFNFNCIVIYLMNVISGQLHNIEIDDLILLLKQYLNITLAVTAITYLILILLVRWFFFLKLKIYFNQILLLKKIFKIFEIQDQ